MSREKKQKKHWSELGRRQQVCIVLLGIGQVALAVIAGCDLAKRPVEQVRGGRKWPWAMGLAANWVGPIAYLTVGREKPTELKPE